MNSSLLNVLSVATMLALGGPTAGGSPEDQKKAMFMQVGVLILVIVITVFILTRKGKNDLKQIESLTSEDVSRLTLLNQQKQLYWIRIIGIPFLFAAIGGFLAILFRK
jgi:hypothetical protein